MSYPSPVAQCADLFDTPSRVSPATLTALAALAALVGLAALVDLVILAAVFVLWRRGAPAAARPKDRGAAVYIIEGEIAAGKTALTHAVATWLTRRGLKVCPILEPVHLWDEVGILKQFYMDPARYAYSFQTYVYATRVLEIRAAIQAAPDADVYLLERSPATDMIFMELQRDIVAPMEMAMYRTWCASYAALFPFDFATARVVYLKTSLDTCMRRLARRQRAGEVPSGPPVAESAAGSGPAEGGPAEGPAEKPRSVGGVSIEYQIRLRRAHEAFFLGMHPGEFPFMPASPFPRDSVIEVSTDLADGNFRDPGPERDRIVAAIVAAMGVGLRTP